MQLLCMTDKSPEHFLFFLDHKSWHCVQQEANLLCRVLTIYTYKTENSDNNIKQNMTQISNN